MKRPDGLPATKHVAAHSALALVEGVSGARQVKIEGRLVKLKSSTQVCVLK